MPDVQFDRYYRYDALTEILKGFAAEYPQLVQLSSIGQSHEGRDVWLATVTNSNTGPASEKPALWVDANIHATEVSPSSAALYLLHTLTTQYGQRDDITRALDTRTFYICPRLNPDGAELFLADKPRMIRSSTRPYPYDEEPLPEGWLAEDVDGDGRMLMMRIPDPNGPWKAHPDEPRLMVRRDPTEIGGSYYYLLREGRIEDYDGSIVFPQPIRENLDLNRNFPAMWRQEHEQVGAGPFPTSEPEVRNLVQAITERTNITGAITFHTWSGVLLRPYGSRSDDDMPPLDLWTFKKIGEKGTELTGYPAISVFHDFKYQPKEVITGVFDEWVYEHRGVYAWTVELWSPQRQAGITDYKYIEWYREHPLEDDLKLLQWSDTALEGKGYVDWYAYEHPQLGPIELGGWDMAYAWRNPPPHLLEKEIAPFADWATWHVLISPLLEVQRATLESVGADAHKLTLVVQNTGWLPTYVTQKYMEKKPRGVMVELTLPDGVTLHSGKLRHDMGQLEGRAYQGVTATPWTVGAATPDRAKAEWVLQGPAGAEIQVTIRHERAGTLVRTFRMPL